MTHSHTPGHAVASGACPVVHGASFPVDGTPLRPSSTFAEWRAEAPATRLRFADGSDGWLVTRFEMAKAVLEDARFSQQPARFPVADESPSPISPDNVTSLVDGNMLGLDDPTHALLRRTVTNRFSVRSVRSHREAISDFASRQLSDFLAAGGPADLHKGFAEPVSEFAHRRVLGIPEGMAAGFHQAFIAEGATTDSMFDFVRAVMDAKRADLGEDAISDLLRADLTRHQVEGMILLLMGAGRDAVAYLISTSTYALLQNPEQLAILREDLELVPAAVEEFIRFGGMFVSTFSRTALEDVTIGGITFSRGESVVVSPVAVNRDPDRFANPDEFDVTREAFGHVGFGHGLHACLGQQLARVEIAEAMTQVIRDVPSLRLVRADQADPLPFASVVPTYEPGEVIVDWG